MEANKFYFFESAKKYFSDNYAEIILHNILSIIIAVIIFFIGRIFAKRASKIAGKLLRKIDDIDETLVRFLENIIYYFLLIVIILACLNRLGVETTSIIAVLGAAGLAIGLALKDSLANFASGVMIVLFKPFKVGDNITASGMSGTVTEVSIFNTVLTTVDNQKIIIPNGLITKGTILNVNANTTRRIDLIVGISYEDNISHAKEAIKDIINNNEKILKEKPIRVDVLELADSSVNFIINAWVNTSDFGSTKSELLEKIKTKFDELHISIPYPKQDVYYYNKN